MTGKAGPRKKGSTIAKPHAFRIAFINHLKRCWRSDSPSDSRRVRHTDSYRQPVAILSQLVQGRMSRRRILERSFFDAGICLTRGYWHDDPGRCPSVRRDTSVRTSRQKRRFPVQRHSGSGWMRTCSRLPTPESPLVPSKTGKKPTYRAAK